MSHQIGAVVSMGRVMVAESAATVGSLRWGLFWDTILVHEPSLRRPRPRGQSVGATLVEVGEVSLAAGRTFVSPLRCPPKRRHTYRRLGYVDLSVLLLPDEPTALILRESLA